MLRTNRVIAACLEIYYRSGTSGYEKTRKLLFSDALPCTRTLRRHIHDQSNLDFGFDTDMVKDWYV